MNDDILSTKCSKYHNETFIDIDTQKTDTKNKKTTKNTKLLFVIYVFYLASKAFISGHFNRCKSFKTSKLQNHQICLNQYLVCRLLIR